MRIALAIAVTLIFAGTASAITVDVSARAKAVALGQIADTNLAGNEATILIKRILEGQEYDYRVSILSTVCSQKQVFDGPKQIIPPITCGVRIGVDNLHDGDNGWGTIYRLDYTIDNKNEVLGAALVTLAE